MRLLRSPWRKASYSGSAFTAAASNVRVLQLAFWVLILYLAILFYFWGESLLYFFGSFFGPL